MFDLSSLEPSLGLQLGPALSQLVLLLRQVIGILFIIDFWVCFFIDVSFWWSGSVQFRDIYGMMKMKMPLAFLLGVVDEIHELYRLYASNQLIRP